MWVQIGFKGSSISSRTHYKGWKRDFLFLTLQKQAKKQHFLPFHPYLALFWKRDEPNYAYYSHFSLCIFLKNVIFLIVQGISTFKKVFGFSKIWNIIWKLKIDYCMIYRWYVGAINGYLIIIWMYFIIILDNIYPFLKKYKWVNGAHQRRERVHQRSPLLFESKSRRPKLQQ